MKNLFTISLLVLVASFSQAQYAGGATSGSSATSGSASSVAGQAISQFLGPMSEANDKRKSQWLENAQGSPYTSNKFAPTVLYYDNEKIGKIYYRYNALNEEIEIKKTIFDDEGYRALTNDKKASLLIDGKKMAFNTFVTSKNRTTNGYLTQLISGKNYDLYKRITVKFTEGTPAQNSFVAAVPARFTQFTEYYYQKKDVNRIDEIITKNAKLLRILDVDAKNKTKAFIKENNLNIKKEADLLKVFEFLNT